MNGESKFTKSELIFYIALAVLVGLFLRCFLTADVSGESMLPTFNNNDFILVSKTSNIECGDIVVLKKTGYDKYFIKRVIAKGGDEVVISPYGVSVNGVSLEEDYINTVEDVSYSNYTEVVADNSYFVLGDNRNHSSDSRIFGDVSEEEILGVVKVNLTSIGLTRTNIFILSFITVLVGFIILSKISKKV